MDTNLINKFVDSVNISDVVKDYIELKKKGNNLIGLCPFHGDTNPSFIVNEKKNLCKCFSCNNGGNAINFIRKIENLSFGEAVQKLKRYSNLPIEELNKLNTNPVKVTDKEKIIDVNKKALEFYKRFLHDDLYKYAKDFLKDNRGLSENIIEKFELGFIPNKNDLMYKLLTNKNNLLKTGETGFSIDTLLKSGITRLYNGIEYDFWKNRIMIPIFDENGVLVSFSGRDFSGQDQVKYLSGISNDAFEKSKILFNLNNVFKDHKFKETLFITEGFMDVLALNKIGIENSVGLMGVALSNEHIKKIKKMPNLTNIVLMLDNDQAGLSANKKIYEQLKDEFDVFVLDWKNACRNVGVGHNVKDVDELVGLMGKSGINFNERKDLLIDNVENFSMYLLNEKRNEYSDLGLKTFEKKELVAFGTKLIMKEPNFYTKTELAEKICEITNMNLERYLNIVLPKNTNDFLKEDKNTYVEANEFEEKYEDEQGDNLSMKM